MNIFYIDRCPLTCVPWMVDKHIRKMGIESAQMLSTAHRVLDGKPYVDKTKSGRKIVRYDHPWGDTIHMSSYVNHPCNRWVRESKANYQWLAFHFAALLDEYFYRFGKQHACARLKRLYQTPINIPDRELTPPALAMPDIYKVSDDPVENYRNFYKYGKSHLHQWTRREPPDWLK